MATCESCGNEYDKCFEVKKDGIVHVFDSFECAINILAPKCTQCGTLIMGHGVEAENTIYCCAHCAKHVGEKGLNDRSRHAG